MDLFRQIHQSIDLSPVKRLQHNDRAIVFLAPRKSELLNGLFVDQFAGKSSAAAAPGVGGAFKFSVVEVLDVVMVPGVAATGPVMAGGKRSVTVVRGSRSNHRMVRAVVVDLVPPGWRGTGSRINESRAVDDQRHWTAVRVHRTAFRVHRQASARDVLTVGLEVHARAGGGG